MLSSGVWCSLVLCASTWGNPDRGARRVSSWGIRMELILIALRTPCHPGEGSLHLAHTDGPPCSIAYSTRGGIPSADISHPDVSQPDGRGGRFNLPCQTCPDPLIALTRRVFLSVYSAAVFSWTFLIFPTDILRYFGIFCFRYLLSKSPNSPCNPPIIGFLSL